MQRRLSGNTTTPRRRGWRALAGVLAVAIGANGLIAMHAEAVTVVPFSAQFDQDVYGDFTIIGNGVMTCPPAAVGDVYNAALSNNPGNCIPARNTSDGSFQSGLADPYRSHRLSRA